MSKIDYSTPLGLLKRWGFETEPENSFLYALQTYMLGEKQYHAALYNYMSKIFYTKNIDGEAYIVFNNHIDERQVVSTPYTSHDQLTAYVVWAPYNAVEIWRLLKLGKFSYDNLNPGKFNKKRIMHPRDILFYGIMAGSTICKVLSPLMYLTGITMALPYRLKKRKEGWKLENKNSNEILWWLRLKVLPRGPANFVFKAFYRLCIKLRFGDLHGLMLDYYADPEHPVCVAAKGKEIL